MLESDEVKIGNWVIDETGQEYQIKYLDSVPGVTLKMDGIPLTKQVFEKCGFEKGLIAGTLMDFTKSGTLYHGLLSDGFFFLSHDAKHTGMHYLKELQNKWHYITVHKLEIETPIFNLR